MLGPPLVSVAPAPAPAMDAEDGGGGGATNRSSMVVAPDLAKDQGVDTIEYSSSFGDTSSGFEGDAEGAEPEVNSVISARANGGGYSMLPRRKKVACEWRNYVLPVLWRCQWLELRMKELSSQVSKYDRELALIKKEKELQHELSKANGSMSESMQIRKDHGDSIMKRRKRKRHEENVDTSLYINRHHILSYYYDKQNKGSETGGLLIDDDCDSTVGLDTLTLLDSEAYYVIFEQLTLKDTLMTIDGLQSRVHLLQNHLSEARSGGENFALSEDKARVRVPRKRLHAQKCSFSYTKCRYTKPQKRKNLNILLKDDDGSALGRPALPNGETDACIKDANRYAEERSGERNHSREKVVAVDLLLSADNSISNGHIEDLCKENTDDILIGNQAANEACQQFDKAKHLPSETYSKGQNFSDPAEMKNISAPAEVKDTCAPAEIDSTSALVVEEPVSPQSKQVLKSKKRRKKGFFSSKKQRKEASKTPAAKEKTKSLASVIMNKTGSTSSAAAVEKTKSTPYGAMGLGTMAAWSAGKKCKTGNAPADAKKRESGSASKNQETGKPSSVAKEQETENPSGDMGLGTMAAWSAGKKRKTGNAPADAKKHESGSALKNQETGKPSSAAKQQETEIPSPAAKKQKTGNPSSAKKKHETGNMLSTTETEASPI